MKVVVYTQRVEVVESYGERRDCADQKIAEFIRECGYLPIPLPNNVSIVKEIVSAIRPAGIVLVGGNSQVKYGGNAPERDETDAALIEIASKSRIPLYGFCRGMQSILDFFGNDLVKIEGHVAVRHRISGCDESSEVNSYHNYACVQLKNSDLVAVMRSEDGVIEKIKHSILPIVGTMWHPEREKPFQRRDLDMLKRLIENETTD